MMLETVLEAAGIATWVAITVISGPLCKASSGPYLLEFWGPLFMSTGATEHCIYRLSEVEGGTRIDFKHTLRRSRSQRSTARRLVPGWKSMHARVKREAEALSRQEVEVSIP